MPARRVRMNACNLYRGIHCGDLRHVVCGSRYYVTMEWVHIWMFNAPYRIKAREMVRRLFTFTANQTGRPSGS